MRRLLLATTAIGALVLAPALALAQVQSNGPAGAIQEQPQNQQPKAPQGGKPVTQKPAPLAPGKSAQTETPPASQQPQRLQGQAQPQKEPGSQQRLQGQAEPSRNAQAPQELQGQAQQQGAPQHVQGQAQPRQGAAASAHGQVQVTQRQRTEIRQRLAHTRVDRIEHPRFSVSVGAEIPRSVHVEVLPPAIVDVVPEYQGFDYVMVGDEILIVDPDSMQIVAVIPA